MEKHIPKIMQTPLFAGIKADDLSAMLKCLNGFTCVYKKGEYVLLEQEEMKNLGVIIEGAVDMLKEDAWGGKSMLMRLAQRELFGETFCCGDDNTTVVSFRTAKNSTVLFIPFKRVMRTCTLACVFHHRLIENMVTLIAEKNRRLMYKIDVLSKKTLREKILAYLNQQAVAKGSQSFEAPLSRVEMAEYLCADRSALTRELAKMQAEGIIDYNKNNFTLL